MISESDYELLMFDEILAMTNQEIMLEDDPTMSRL